MRDADESLEGAWAGMIYRTYIKRLFDILISLLGLPALLLILLVCGPLIWLEDRGPVFYNAERLGRNGRVFKMYKLRSMRVNAPDIRNEDGSTFNAEDDPRVTRIGRFLRKTSLDETPQLLNVLKGDMSLIGPRPNMPGAPFEDLPELERRRLAVRPGVTGYNQAYFRNSVPAEERFVHDVYYVEHASFLFDIKILARTVVTVVKREHINAEPEALETERHLAAK